MAYLSIVDPGPQPIRVIKALREVTKCGLKDAKDCVEGTIQLDLGEIDNAQKARIKQALGDAGLVKCTISKRVNVQKPLIAVAPAPKVKTWHERLLED